MNETDGASRLVSTVVLNSAQTWRLEVGQCPGFDSSSTFALGAKLAAYGSAISVFVGFAVVMVVVMALWHERDARLRVELALRSDTERAHKWILGYGAVRG